MRLYIDGGDFFSQIISLFLQNDGHLNCFKLQALKMTEWSNL